LEIARKNRIRRIVSELNKQRRLQSRKIDILCNDIVKSQRAFLNQLKIMSLQIELYESLIGEHGLEHVLDEAANAIGTLVGGANIAIWLGSSFESHVFDEQEFTSEQTDLIESCFTSEIADKIYKSRRCMEIDELSEIGLPQAEILTKLSAAVIPLQDICQQGFVLIYRTSDRPIKPQEMDDVAVLVPGLSKAVRVCYKTPQHTQAVL
jgi:hypothetical protein